MCSFKTFSVPCLFLSVLVLNLNSANAQEEGYTPVAAKPTRCYDPYGKAQRCIPEFENAAFNVMMEATNTCGERGDQEFCNQAGFSEIKKSCELCHPNQHHAQYLTDFHNSDAPTWWQSETMMEGIQYPNQVNLTLRLGKAYDITYIRLWFMSPRPESFAIYKRSSENSPWIPFQYYSASCRDTYGLPDTLATIKGEESRALCKSEYSDISPLRGGNVVFSSLDGRPSAYFYDVTPELHEWVTATDIRITLDRLNTFGEEVFGVEHVLRSYFYAIADINVGARCKCNGHASECPESTSLDGSRRRVCKCEHNTAGPDCNECLPFYNDAPWKRGSAKNAFECKKCNCNNYSERCYFDKDLYEQTGHGGHCLDCRENRDGPNCERCRENYYMREDGYCIACDCDAVGSRNLQCNSEGKCQCKVGVGGDKCNRCEINHFDFGNQGCKNCGCSEIGSYDNKPTCNQNTGTCDCKENVEGKRCRECKPGYFNLDAINEFGCTPCFCYGHSSQCVSATGYSKYTVGSNFAKSSERWRAEDEYRRKIDIQYNALSQSIGVTSAADEIVYFVAPERFLGDQRASYNQILQFTLRIGNNRVQPSPTDVILEGSGERVATTIFAQRNNKPGVENQVYKFRLHEDQKYGWEPRLSAIAFISILTNLTAIRIRGTFAPHDVGFLDDIKLETAHRGIAGESVRWVEQCDCPTGYVGQFCESCAPGYRHAPSLGGPFMKCIPCDCNKHADICDSETGRCICQHNTGGDNCEVCARGYYGNALGGTTDDCQPCGCPNGGACIQIGDNETICTECPVGYTGHRCDACYDGYFGDPTGKYGPEVPCQACECNENIDNNAIGNCNTTTGECLKCIHNTGGDLCEKCLPGYYGNALALPKGNCHPCECFSIGTEDAEGALNCNPVSGACVCKPHVVGKNCDQCEDGFFKLYSGKGCESCDCNAVGSLNQTCDLNSGQCFCRPGVTGLKCDHCEPRKYGFSMDGCKECECDIIGSKELQCDGSGQCPCLDNVEGRRCDRCKENKYDRQRGCVDCPDCYNLVQNATQIHKDKLKRLSEYLDDIERSPTVVADDEFADELSKLQLNIEGFHDTVVKATGQDSVVQQVQNINERKKEISRTLSEIEENIELATDKVNLADQNITNAENTLDNAKSKLEDITNSFEVNGKKALEDAWERAKIVGQQSEKMTEIAQEARDIADKLDKQANDITERANEARNKSNEAYLLAENALSLQENVISTKERELRNDLNKLENNLNKTKELTEEVSEKAKEAKKEALDLLSQANNLVIPEVDVGVFKRKSDEIKELADDLRVQADKLLEENDELVMDINEQVVTGIDLLERGNDQKQDLDDYTGDIHFAKKIAEVSIKLAEDRINQTQETYKILSGFDKEAQKNKKAAEEALGQIPEIEKKIIDALQKTSQGQESISDAKKNADSAFKKAEDADDLAKKASANAEKIKSEAEVLYANASGLEKEADLMSERISRTKAEFKQLEDQNRSNETLVAHAKDNVGRAGKETQEASKKVNELLEDVQEIINELQNLPNIDEKALDELENKLKIAEQKVADAKLDEKLAHYKAQQKIHDDLIAEYEKEIEMLEKDVENIQQIANSLPDGCFKKIDLEP